MARQKGIIKIKGTIGDITFYKTKDGYLVKEKSGVDASRIATDPAFQRTRENGSEFGRAGKAGKVLRLAYRPLLLRCSDSRMVSRLTQSMMKTLQTDTVNSRGMRNVVDGDTTLLKGFEFNIHGKLSTTMFAPYVANINRVTGTLTIDLLSFVPTELIAAPTGTTHFKIVSGGAEIDFVAENHIVEYTESAILPWNENPTTAITQTNTVTAASTLPLFLVLGVEFYQEVNGEMYSLKNGAYNSLSLVAVSGV
jgi:hypothetical protein